MQDLEKQQEEISKILEEWPTYPVSERSYNPRNPGYLLETTTFSSHIEEWFLVPRHKGIKL